MKGEIVSLKNKGTAVVKVERVFSHPLYGKTVKKHKNYQAGLGPKISVENLRLGQRVEVVPGAPQSSKKRFLLINVYD